MMKKQLTVAVAAGGFVLGTLAMAQMGMSGGMGQGMGGPGMMGPGSEGGAVLRHRYVMTNGIDPKYANARNPLAASAATLREGRILYEKNCVACHGISGHGDGPASKGMNPAPADVTAAIRMPIASDAYLDWTISEGGVPVQSAMPPFKTTLSNDEIWKVILYLRTLQSDL